MITTAIIAISTCILLVLSVILFPKVKILGKAVSTFWPVCLLGAIAMTAFGCVSPKEILDGLTADGAINPLKILVLFLSMTFLSVYLDEMGFFRYVAVLGAQRAKGSQLTLFLILYAIVSVLTVFTSNDVVILTFTPFICYFAKQAKVNPLPYLVTEFCASNTWSMMLIIGNPTNVYLATGAGIDFMSYLSTMAIPTILGGAVQLGVLLMLFRKRLAAPLCVQPFESELRDKVGVALGLVHLGVCLVLLVLSSYVALEMWTVCLACAVSLILCVVAVAIKRGQKPDALLRTAARLPWSLVPFVLSMFVVVLALKSQGITTILANLLSGADPVISYGLSSFVACNLMNNIPMSVLFASVPQFAESVLMAKAIFATIVGSNLGAFLTPIGALAGIMFTDLVSMRKVKFGFLDFIRYGSVVAVPTLIATLLGLAIVL